MVLNWSRQSAIEIPNGTEICHLWISRTDGSSGLSSEDVDAFVAACNKENIDAVVVATVTEKPNLVMHWNGRTIVDLERRFPWYKRCACEINGSAKVVDKDVKLPGRTSNICWNPRPKLLLLKCPAAWTMPVKKGLQTIFDSSVGRSTVNHPPSGRCKSHQRKLLYRNCQSMAWQLNCICHSAKEFQPLCSRMVSHHGAAYAVIEAHSSSFISLLLSAEAGLRLTSLIKSTSSGWINKLRAFLVNQ